MQVGQTIGNYNITAKLGEGGMGVVYLAEHPVIGRKVAMKAIHPSLSRNPEVVSRFITEAKSVNQIGNEHIVDIMDFGNTSDGEFYFVMEFLQGEALADRLKRVRVLPPPLALQIAAQVADALAASHAHGIVHRDLKPENIFLINRGGSADFVKVLDFGLAKLTQGDEKVSHKTRTGSVMGTPYYMAPEQCEGKASVDHRADEYSLGVILFEMLTGRVPFGGEGYGEIIVKHITNPAPSPRAINPRLSVAHELVILRSLAKRREDRFAGMVEFREAILNPERYAQANPNLPFTPAPVNVAPIEVSFDDQARGESGIVGDARPGTKARPQPTTFRESAVEMMSAEGGGRRSRKGLIAGLVGAVAAASFAALVFTKKDQPVAMAGSTAAPVEPAVTAVTRVRPAHAAAVAPAVPVAVTVPATVKIAFSSEPAGATVTSSGSGKIVGTTPCEHEFPRGSAPIEFVFSMTGFEPRSMSFVPEISTRLATTLKAFPAAARAAEPAAEKIRPVYRSSGTSKKSNRPVDEDGVLEPSFK